MSTEESRERRRVKQSTQPGCKAFIGPMMPRREKNRLKMAAHREKTGARVKFTTNPGHPLFIGPIRPKEVRYRASSLAYSAAHRQELRDYGRVHREGYKKKRNLLLNHRRKTDPAFAIEQICRCRTLDAIRRARTSKQASFIDLVGCTNQELAAHIESRFLPGMTWENRGRHGWHIDHILPCAGFDLNDPDHQAVCFHYTNLRPMWGAANIQKSDRLTSDAIALLSSPGSSAAWAVDHVFEIPKGYGAAMLNDILLGGHSAPASSENQGVCSVGTV